TDYDPLVEALNAGTYDTVIGTLEFNETGDVTLPGYVFYAWNDGQYDYLTPDNAPAQLEGKIEPGEAGVAEMVGQ
ncbi:MAG TPA: hypothetical protein VHG92_14850, partial [Afifellaceae bacterium]|nr:hypothetical protein [Afifellaceae bacterium]